MSVPPIKVCRRFDILWRAKQQQKQQEQQEQQQPCITGSLGHSERGVDVWRDNDRLR